MARVTQDRADPDLVELLVTRSFDTLKWMTTKGIRLIPIYGRQAFKIDGKFKFWGGLTVEAVGGGPGLVQMLTDAALRNGIKIKYDSRAVALIYENGRVNGVRIRQDDGLSEVAATSVIPACRGLQAHAEKDHRYLGAGRALAK